jgi:hypothetical protein
MIETFVAICAHMCAQGRSRRRIRCADACVDTRISISCSPRCFASFGYSLAQYRKNLTDHGQKHRQYF